MLQAVLLDRDGVINRERADYVKSWAEFELLPGALDALHCLAMRNVPVLVITNQSCVGRGIVAPNTLDEIHFRLRELVLHAGGRLDAFYVCPHTPETHCYCRKPMPGLLLRAARDFGLNLERCVFVGDSLTDYLVARAVGCAPLLVRSGRQGPELCDLVGPDVPVVADLAAAVELILCGPVARSRVQEVHHAV